MKRMHRARAGVFRLPAEPAPVMDLSKIGFEALRGRFKESKHKKPDLEVLKAAIRAQLDS